MVREALIGYWSLVSGLTEVTLERARAAAKSLVAQGDATREQVSGLAQEIADTSKANREALLKLVRYETERAAGRLGFASSDEVSVLQGRVRELEGSIARLRAAADAAEPTATTAAGAEQPAATAETARATAAKTTAAKAGPTPPAGAAGQAKPAKASKAAKSATAGGTGKLPKAGRATKATKATKATNATKAAKAGPRRSAGSPS